MFKKTYFPAMIYVTYAIIVNTEGDVLVTERSAKMSLHLKKLPFGYRFFVAYFGLFCKPIFRRIKNITKAARSIKMISDKPTL